MDGCIIRPHRCNWQIHFRITTEGENVPLQWPMGAKGAKSSGHLGSDLRWRMGTTSLITRAGQSQVIQATWWRNGLVLHLKKKNKEPSQRDYILNAIWALMVGPMAHICQVCHVNQCNDCMRLPVGCGRVRRPKLTGCSGRRPYWLDERGLPCMQPQLPVACPEHSGCWPNYPKL